MTQKNQNLLKRIAIVQDIVKQYYEEGNQSKSKRQVWKHYVNPLYPMGERTFYRYMGIDLEKEKKKMEIE